jgi:glyoxylase-like metal-dependent hydrolase (beta-lactamase superfamily II)
MKANRFAVVAIILACSSVAFSQSPDFAIKKVGDNVYAAIGVDGGKAGSDAGFVVGDKGVLVVDTFTTVEAARALLDEIKKVTPQPVRFVVNTHYHLDHTGGNAVFAEAGATIIAHHNLRGWVRTENLKFFGADPKPEQKARVEALVPPDETYDQAMDVYLGSRRVHLRYLPGHTGGDTVVFVPDANVVFGGDLVWQKHLPNLIDATTSAWVETLDHMLQAHPNATFVPGHGDVATPADVRDFRNYLSTLRDAIAKAKQAGKSGQALQDEVLPQIQAQYGTWGFFKNFAPRNIAQTEAELAGTKKVPQAAGQ